MVSGVEVDLSDLTLTGFDVVDMALILVFCSNSDCLGL